MIQDDRQEWFEEILLIILVLLFQSYYNPIHQPD